MSSPPFGAGMLRGSTGLNNQPASRTDLPAEDKNTGVAMVIFCGGGYGAVCIGSEGLPMQKFLNNHGIAVFMVSYRCSPFNHPIPLWDAQRAMRIMRKVVRFPRVFYSC